MKSQIRRLLAAGVALVMLMGGLPTSAFASSNDGSVSLEEQQAIEQAAADAAAQQAAEAARRRRSIFR